MNACMISSVVLQRKPRSSKFKVSFGCSVVPTYAPCAAVRENSIPWQEFMIPYNVRRLELPL